MNVEYDFFGQKKSYLHNATLLEFIMERVELKLQQRYNISRSAIPLLSELIYNQVLRSLTTLKRAKYNSRLQDRTFP